MVIALYFQFTCNLQVDPGWCIHLQVTNDPLELNWSKEILVHRNSHPPGVLGHYYSSREVLEFRPNPWLGLSEDL